MESNNLISDFTNLAMVCNAKLVGIDLNSAQKLLDNNLFNFDFSGNKLTGEVNNYHFAEFKGLKIKVYTTGRIEIRGSLHKYWNNGLHNYNDFGLHDIRSSIRKFECEFGLDSDKIRVHNLEIGFNIRHKFDTNELLGSIVAYSNKHVNDSRYSGNGRMRKVESSQYILKSYNKGIMHDVDVDLQLVRFEKQIKKMEVISKQPIYLSTLGTTDFFHKMYDNFIDSFDNLVFTENLDLNKLSIEEQLIYNTGENPRKWEQMNVKTRYNHKKAFNELIDTKGTKLYRRTMKQLISDKKNLLLQDSTSINTRYIGPEYSDRLNTISDHSNDEDLSSINPMITVNLPKPVTTSRTIRHWYIKRVSFANKLIKIAFKLTVGLLPTRSPKSDFKNRN